MLSSALSHLSHLRTQAGPVVRSASWWRQQIWVVLTEVLMGFLAVLGFVRGMELQTIALGLGLAYALSWLGLIPLVRGNRWQAVALGVLTGALALVAAIPGPLGWWALAAASGLLLAFRDAQGIQSFLWVPIRAMRVTGGTVASAHIGQGLGMIHTAVWMVTSTWMMQHTTWWPAAVLWIAVAVGVPDVIRQRPTDRPAVDREHRISARRAPALHWLVRLSSWYNAMHFLGRRLVMPAALVALAQHWNMGDQAVVFIGAVLSGVGVIGAFIRGSMTAGSVAAHHTMIKGLEFSLAGWLVMAAGAALVAWWPGWFAGIAIVAGWVLMETAVRLWSVGYMETLRLQSTIRVDFRRMRAHREALSHYMRHKNAAASAGLMVAGLASPAAGPLLIGGMGVACWRVLKHGRHHVETLAAIEQEAIDHDDSQHSIQ